MSPCTRSVHVALTSAGAIAVLLLSAPAVDANQWYIEPSANLGAFYDDNVRLSVKDAQSSLGGRALAKVQTGRRTEVSEIGIGATVSTIRYNDLAEFDRTDGSLGLVSAYQLDRSRFGFDANFDYDSTLTSEIQTSGLLQVNKRRSRLVANPTWSYALSPRANIDARFRYEDVSYQDVEVIPLYDYTFTTLGLSTAYALSERARITGRLSYDQYEAARIKTESDSFGLDAGLNYLLSETLTFNSFAGIRYTESQTPVEGKIEKTDNSGPLFELGLKKQFETGGLSFSANRSLLPSSDGTLLDTIGLSLAFDRQLTQLWKFQIAVQGYRNSNPGGEVSANDRDYVALEPRLERRLSDSLRLDLGYRYRRQSREIEDNDAVSNSVFLTLNYAAPREWARRWISRD